MIGRDEVSELQGQESLRTALVSLTRKVGIRLSVRRFARGWYLAFLISACSYLIVLLVSRLLALLPRVFSPLSLICVPVCALLAALVWFRRVTISDCARAVDRAEGTKDLFLTAVLLDPKSPEFSKLVVSGAVDRGKHVDSRKVVPWGGGAQSLKGMAIMALLLSAVLWVPQLDPFGHEAKREERQVLREELEETRRVTEVRKAQLKRHTPARERSEEVELRIEELKKTFAKMKPGQPKANSKALTSQQQELGKSWQRAKHATASLGALPRLDQGFGAESPRAEQWRKQLAKGDGSGLKEELNGLRELSRQLDAMPDGRERDALERELSRRLQELSRFANDKMTSPALSSALSRALAQAKMGQSAHLSQEAMEALAESLDLAELELSQLQQAMNDLRAMEEALRTLQLAQRCNQQDGLDGSASTNCNSLAAYAELYQQILAQQGCGDCEGCVAGTGCTSGGRGSGRGMGMGGPGQGEGGVAPEDDGLATDYKSEKSQSAMRAGKILMQWQTDESADKGRVAVDYDRQIRDLREGISEAVLNESIPPLYHGAIQRYFDALASPADADEIQAPPENAEGQE